MIKSIKNFNFKHADSNFDDYIIKYQKLERGLTRFASNMLTQNIVQEKDSIIFTGYKDRKKITLSTNNTTTEGINDLLARTQEMLKYSLEDLEYVPSYDGSENNENEVSNEVSNEVTTDKASEKDEQEKFLRMKMVGAALSKVRTDANSPLNLNISGTAESAKQFVAVATKNGARRFLKRSFAEYSNTIEYAGERAALKMSCNKETDIDYLNVFDSALEDVKLIVKKGKRSFDPGRYDVLLSSRATSDFMGVLFSYGLDRRSYDEGHSPLVGKIKSKIADSSISIYTDPLSSKLSSANFTSEGRPIKKHYFIKDGILEDLPTSPFWANKNNLKEWSMGNIIWEDNNIFEKDLLKQIKRGFYIKEFWYIRMVRKNDFTLTGMTRNGIFYVEDGEIVSSSNHFRWNESPLSVLNRIVAFSKGYERRSFGGFDNYFPAILVKDFYLSSKTGF
ncbi:MAG: hypothetical protein HQK49_05395 [Oligoflexia bacterium]|nr:hypothetical protein [Oligoflexia bacterium]